MLESRSVDIKRSSPPKRRDRPKHADILLAIHAPAVPQAKLVTATSVSPHVRPITAWTAVIPWKRRTHELRCLASET